MGPNGFMGRTLLALQVLFRNVYFIQAFDNDAQGSKLMLANSQNVGDFDNLRVRKISTSKCLRVRIIHVSQTKGENLLTVTDVSITCAVFIFWVTLKMNTTDCRNARDCQQQQSYSGLRSPGHSGITFFCFYFVVSFCGLYCKSLDLKQWALTEELYTSKHTFIFLQCNPNIWTSIHIIGTKRIFS